MSATRHDPDAILLGLARAVRAAGVAVTADRERTFLAAAAVVGLADAAAIHAAGRATLCSSPADIARYEQVFLAWFTGEFAGGHRGQTFAPTVATAALEEGDGASGGPVDEDIVRANASAAEVLRRRDIADLSPAEKASLATLFARIHPVAPTRTSRRRTPASRGRVDGRAMLRDQVHRMGEPGPVRRHERGRRPRRIVLLVDVSGSMSAYADALLRLAHRFVHAVGHTEVFTLGTRLTHVTRALATPDPDRALVAAGEAVPDWSGGTRLGEGIEAFLDRWGRRGMARGAVVVVFSDGWERESPELLGEQMRRLAGLAHHVIWANPHRGKDGYQPIQQGIMAVLPHCDDLVAGHSLHSFTELATAVARA